MTPKVAFRPSAAGVRPASRVSAGQSFTDAAGNTAFSNGVWWWAGGLVVGNRANPYRACNQGGDPAKAPGAALGQYWQQFGGTCSVALGQFWNGTAPGKLLLRQAFSVVTCNATGAGLGYCEVSQKLSAAGDFSDFPAVVAGSTYTIVAQTTGETQAANMGFRRRWRDAAGVPLATDAAPAVTGGAVNSTVALTTSYLTGGVAPANAVWLDTIVRFTRAGIANGEKYNIVNLGIFLDPTGIVSTYSEP